MAIGISIIGLVYAITMILSGSGSSLTLKGMNVFKTPTCSSCEPSDFNHSYMQTYFMFIGEFLCFAVYGFEVLYQKKKGIKQKPVPEGKQKFKFFPHVFLFFVPTICDTLASTCYNVGLYYSQVSVYQMLRNLTVVFVAVLSTMFQSFRQTFDLPQGIGLLGLVSGAMIISYSAIGFSDESEAPAKNPVLGIVMIIVGSIFAALWCVTEEIFLRKIHVNSRIGVGIEGMWGILIYSIIMLPVANFVDDPFTNEVPKPKMEDTKAWAYRLAHSAPLVILHLVYLIFVLVFNFSGMEVTQHVNASSRATFDAIRTIIVWIVSFIAGWEVWHNIATPIRFLGFVLVTLSVLIYNNITMIIPFMRQVNIDKYGKLGCRKQKKETDIRMKVEVGEIVQ